MKCLVLGNGLAGVNTVEALKREKVDVIYVYQYGDEKITKQICGIHFIPKTCDEESLLNMYIPDVVISSGWQRKIKSKILNNWECYNIHPSLLPKYRGIGALERQLMNHESIGGLTMHKMDINFDTGPIYMQLSYKITDRDNIESLLHKNYKCVYKIINSFVRDYPNIYCYAQEE